MLNNATVTYGNVKTKLIYIRDNEMEFLEDSISVFEKLCEKINEFTETDIAVTEVKLFEHMVAAMVVYQDKISY